MSTVTIDYTPLPLFEPFHVSRSRTRLIIGGYGSGKSHALCAEAIALGFEYPGAELLVMRKTVPALKTTTEKIFLSLLPKEFFDKCRVAKAGGHLDYIQFPNGSLYYFRGCDDWKKLRSMNLAFIVWDEADEFTTEDYDGLQSRVRQTRPTPEAKALGAGRINRNGNIMACNPQGHNWIWEYFVDADNAHHRDDSEYWVSTSFENPHLPIATLNEWLSMPDPWIRRYVLASFDDFAGQIYADWTWDSHVIPPYDHLDPSSYIWMGMDPGTADPTAGVWCYYDKSRHWLVAVAEYQEPGLAANAHAAAWRRIEARFGKTRVSRRVADPTVAARDRGSNMRLSDQYLRLGFNFELGPRLINDRLPMLGQLIVEGRFKATTDCPQVHEQIQNYRWNDLTPHQQTQGTEPKPLKRNVHLVDAAQYIASRYIAPPKIAAVDPRAPDDPELARQYEHDQAIRARIRKQIDTKRTATGRHGDGIVL